MCTYNVLHGMTVRTGQLDLAAAAAAIDALDADVVAMQETDRDLDRSDRVHQVAWLAERLGFAHAFAPSLLGDPDTAWTTAGADDPGGPAYGVGLLSRHPLTRVTRHALPGGGAGRRRSPATPSRPGWDREPRVLLVADVATSDGPVRVATTHLSYLPWRGIAQLRSAAAALADAPTILAGDFNLPVAVVRLVLGRGWDHAGGGPTYPAGRPRMQPDQLIVSGGTRVDAAVVGAPGASDHLPLVATVHWR